MKRHIIFPKLSFNDTIMVLDGRYLAYRTQYSKNMNLSHTGIKTGLYYGFFNTIRSLSRKFLPVNTVIMWDSPGSESIRREEFPGYKHRDYSKLTEKQKQFKEEFNHEYINLIKLCDSLGFASYQLKGYEADDCIALFTNKYKKVTTIVIISKDEDFYQLIDNNVFQYDPDDKVQKNPTWFKRIYGIEPILWVEIKAISGCKSDTVPGYPGVGEKKALDYLKGEDKNEFVQKKINENPDLYNLYFRLVKLPHPNLTHNDIPYKTTKVNKDDFFEFCQMFGFRSFLDKFHDFEIFF